MINLNVKSFKITNATEGIISYKYNPLEITLILDDKTELNIDYIKTSSYSYTTLKHHMFNETLELIEKIRAEHNKLAILGLGYPIYVISFVNPLVKGKNNVTCRLIDFNTKAGKLDTYIVKKFVNNIDIDVWREIHINKLIIKHEIEVEDFGNLTGTIIGTEYIKNINDENIELINNTIAKTQDKTLILNNLNLCEMSSSEAIYGIKRIVLNNTCSITDIPINLFKKIKTLQEIVLCDSVETIQCMSFCECIRREKDKKSYYLNLHNPSKFEWESDSDRHITVKFQNIPYYLTPLEI